VGGLDDWLPYWDVRSRHERAVDASPEAAFGSALASAGSDRLVRTLLLLRGLRGGGSLERFFARHGFETLERTPTSLVVGASGRPWRLAEPLGPFERATAGLVRFAADLRAVPAGGGAVLSTETRVLATDAASRRAFRRYWLVVGPFSGLIRRRWLRAGAAAR
jgi:hypothetical protein